MPRSSAALTTAAVPASSSRPPKLLQPMPTAETSRPERPRCRYSIAGDSSETCCGGRRSREHPAAAIHTTSARCAPRRRVAGAAHGGRSCLFLLAGDDIQRDLDLFADVLGARVHRRVPAQAPVVAVDRGLRAEAGADLAAEGVLPL